jgi:UDP-N-acetyl-D-glucosamine/UDP-N-acetyl-D-galactosamine dehydrogenase
MSTEITLERYVSSPIAIIGLGYVGLPLAVEFGTHRRVIGYDINAERVAEISAGNDRGLECSKEQIAAARYLTCTSDPRALTEAEIFIVAVPTPIDEQKRPDLTPLIEASETIGKVLKKGDIVIYESTVYPGATEDDCVPVLETVSGLKFNVDFFAGYSPERINPGDKVNRLVTIKKVTSGSTPAVADIVDALYRQIITAGTHKAPSIKVAEAAKVIENTQRDVNIALMNEFAQIFNRLGIDTQSVLEAAATKWNFLPFKPGLVGGHCIGVDPYYLIQKAQATGYYPDLLIAARRINDDMGSYVAHHVVRMLIQGGVNPNGARVLILGFAFKENCPDLRNTKVIDLVSELMEVGAKVDVVDSWVDRQQVKNTYGIDVLTDIDESVSYDAVLLAVQHSGYRHKAAAFLQDKAKHRVLVYDLKKVSRL